MTTATRLRPGRPDDAPAILSAHRHSILSLGIATYDLAEVESWAAGLVPERCAALSGQAFYERHGYRVVERRGWKTRGGLLIPVVDMEKMLLSP